MRYWQDVLDQVEESRSGESHCVIESRAVSRVVQRYRPGRYQITDSACGYLTCRELQVIRLMQMGLSNREVAKALSLSPRTTESYVKAVKEKFGVRAKQELLELLKGKLPC